MAAVWPGYTHFPDVLNADARKWFGGWYHVLTDQGIEGFWNDMNEPAIFYSEEGMEEFKAVLREHSTMEEENPAVAIGDKMQALSNNPADHTRFYHTVNGEKICHKDVHNLFGYNMTRAAGEAFERIAPYKRFLMFSRSSYIC